MPYIEIECKACRRASFGVRLADYNHACVCTDGAEPDLSEHQLAQ